MRARQHVLDRVHVQPPARDFRGLRVGRLELREARRLPLGERRDLRLVGLGILLHPQGGALRHGDDAVGVGLGFQDEALLVGLRLVGIALRGNHRVRHLHVLEIDRRDRDPRGVVIEGSLDQILGAPCHLGARRADQQVIEGAAADDLADRALAHLAQGGFRIAHPEQLLHRVRELVLHGEMQVDEIDIRGEHAGLEVAGIHARDIHLGDRLDGPGPAPAHPRSLHVDQPPEALDDAALGLCHLIEAAPQPQAERHQGSHQEQRAAVAAATAGSQQRLEPALPALQALVQVRAASTRAASPRIVRTAWLIPGHMEVCARSALLGRARDGGRL